MKTISLIVTVLLQFPNSSTSLSLVVVISKQVNNICVNITGYQNLAKKNNGYQRLTPVNLWYPLVLY